MDLTNEQVFIRTQGRVTDSTWKNWTDGIRTTLSKPAFALAWTEIKERSKSSFEELKKLETDGFVTDPRKW